MKIRTDAQGRKTNEAGERVYDVAGANTWVEAIHPGTYPANHLRAPGDKFQVNEGHGIVDWMREVEVEDETAPAARKAARAPKPTREAPVETPADVAEKNTEAAADLA